MGGQESLAPRPPDSQSSALPRGGILQMAWMPGLAHPRPPVASLGTIMLQVFQDCLCVDGWGGSCPSSPEPFVLLWDDSRLNEWENKLHLLELGAGIPEQLPCLTAHSLQTCLSGCLAYRRAELAVLSPRCPGWPLDPASSMLSSSRAPIFNVFQWEFHSLSIWSPYGSTAPNTSFSSRLPATWHVLSDPTSLSTRPRNPSSLRWEPASDTHQPWGPIQLVSPSQ